MRIKMGNAAPRVSPPSSVVLSLPPLARASDAVKLRRRVYPALWCTLMQAFFPPTTVTWAGIYP